jgi:hypothetical protein
MTMLTPPSDYDHAEVIPCLYVGAFPPASPFDWGADVIVSLASAHACQSGPRNKLLMHLPIIEGEAPPDEVRRLARLIASQLDDGRCVFIHCVAGRDRSPTLAARVLIEQGWEPKETVQHVRAVRWVAGRGFQRSFGDEPDHLRQLAALGEQRKLGLALGSNRGRRSTVLEGVFPNPFSSERSHSAYSSLSDPFSASRERA